MNSKKFKRHPLSKSVRYFFLFPFVPALQPVLLNFNLSDFLVYLGSILMVLVLIIFGNHRPVIIVHSDSIELASHYPNKMNYVDLKGFKNAGQELIVIYFHYYRPVRIRLTKSEKEGLISTFLEMEVPCLM